MKLSPDRKIGSTVHSAGIYSEKYSSERPEKYEFSRSFEKDYGVLLPKSL